MSHFLPLINIEPPTTQNVSTIWLLATLGRSNNNQSTASVSTRAPVKRKDIINVSIPQTCQIIQKSEGQLSLRHVSNLMYGVTVCYNKKSEFILNDLETLLVQLQRREKYILLNSKNIINSSSTERRVGARTTGVNHLRNNDANVFFLDDPAFDIMDIGTFTLHESSLDTNQGSIRKFDYLNELKNTNKFDDYVGTKNHEADDNFDDIEMNSNLDLELGLDLDLNFNLQGEDEVDGAVHGTSTTPTTSHNDFDQSFNYNEQQIDLNFEPSENNLEQQPLTQKLPELDIENEREASLDAESIIDEPPLKKIKRNSFPNIISTQILKVDERTGIATEMLRYNNEHYLEQMENKKQQMSGSTTVSYTHLDVYKRQGKYCPYLPLLQKLVHWWS